ncbi:MAG: hypothetical protein PVI86_15660 [Phycisphaerae bacterium]|jgi:hypothetical protein
MGCNQNGVLDTCDLASGDSEDCDGDGVPDECGLDCNRNGIADSCEPGDGSDTACNDHGILDGCEVSTWFASTPRRLQPLGGGVSQVYRLAWAPPCANGAKITLTAFGNLAGADRYVDVEINGVEVGRVFDADAGDCDQPPSYGRVTVGCEV